MAWYECNGGGSSPGPGPTPTFENYITNIGGNGIGFNTGHIHTANTKIRFKASIDTWVGQYAQIFGARSSNFWNNAFGFFGRFNYNGYALYRTGSETRGTTLDSDQASSPWNLIPCIFTVEGTTASWYRDFDPETVRSISGGGTVDGGIAPLAIFGCNNSTAANGWNLIDQTFGMVLFWFEIYESDVLVHRFVPAYNNNQYCLYDEVTDTYIYDTVNNGANVRGFVAS